MQERVVKEPKYPHIIFDTRGLSYSTETLVEDVLDELNAHGISSETQDMFRKQALAGDFETAVVVTGEWVTLR